jgi:dynein heavy chain 2, cytosolic
MYALPQLRKCCSSQVVLVQALGRQVLVFNCDEEFDFQSMGRIFVGLMRCGAWGCFDEFNRLEEEVLSSVSQQIQMIQSALKEGRKEVTLLDATCTVDANAGLFVTLNPAGKGYGGRSKLPDNLKALFRSVAMSVPDNEIIAEVMLLSEGFKSAKCLGAKLVTLFDMAKQLLSHQQHYDWGLRSLKTILSVSGELSPSSTCALSLVSQEVHVPFTGDSTQGSSTACRQTPS